DAASRAPPHAAPTTTTVHCAPAVRESDTDTRWNLWLAARETPNPWFRRIRARATKYRARTRRARAASPSPRRRVRAGRPRAKRAVPDVGLDSAAYLFHRV